MMLIYRSDALGMDCLCDILGMIAQQLDQRMLLARWHDGGRTSYMITEDVPYPCRAALEPIVFATPDGERVAASEGEAERQRGTMLLLT